MKETKNDKKNEQSSSVNPVAVVTGALIGAGAIVAGAIAMSDKNNQRKVKNAMNDAKEKIKGYKQGLEDKTQSVQDAAKEKLDQFEGKTQKMKDAAQEQSDEKKQK